MSAEARRENQEKVRRAAGTSYTSFNDAIHKVSSGYSLSTEMSMRFSFVLLISVVGAAVLTSLLEQSGVQTGLRLLEDTVMDSELASMLVRIDQLSLAASSLFVQAINDVTIQSKYAVDNMNFTYGNSRYETGINSYQNYPIAATSPGVMESLVPPGSIKSTSYNDVTSSFPYYNDFYSGWFRKGSYDFSTKSLTDAGTEYLMASRTLDNSFVPLLAANPNYGEVYMGFENSLFRKLPFYDVSSYHATSEAACQDSSVSQGYPCMYFECQLEPKTMQHGYEPVCREWYILAKANQSEAILSPPYLGASKGLAMITIAKSVLVNETSSLIGVIGIDIYIDSLSNSVLSASVLETGYSYLINSDFDIIMHPRASADTLRSVCELEFDSCSSPYATAYQSRISTAIAAKETGSWRFEKSNDDYWWVTYAPVNGTDYFIMMTVPESEVEEIAVAVTKPGNAAVGAVIGVSVGLGVVMLIVGIYLARRVAAKIAGPVQNFNSVLSQINENHMEAINVDLSANEFAQINKLQSRILSLFLAVKFSTNAYYNQKFETALSYLEEVEHMFTSMKQKAAVGVVYNNKGEILRGHANKVKGESKVRRGDKYYSNYTDAFAAIDMALENANSQILLTEKKLEVLNKKRDQKKIQPGTLEDRPYLQLEQTLRHRILTLISTLASRQSNKAICLKDAGDTEDALDMAQNAFSNYEKADDLLGMIKVLGNKGLIYLELSAIPQAERCFLEAYNMAHAKFSNEPSEKSCKAFQHACMNLGVYKIHLLEEARGEANAYSKVKHEALQYFYYAITVSNRVDKQVLSTCVHNIYNIFQRYYKGDEGNAAMRRIEDMFPQLIKSKSKVSFLMDVSPSMNGHERIIKAVNVMKDILTTKLYMGDYFSLDIFAKEHNIIVEPCRLDQQNLPVILDAVYALQYRCTSGSTHFYKSLLEMGKTIASVYRNNKKATMDANHTVLALTDGEDNEYRTTPQEVKHFYHEYGITLIVVTIAVSPRMIKLLQDQLMQKKELLLTAQDDPSSLFSAMQKGFEMATGAATMESL